MAKNDFKALARARYRWLGSMTLDEATAALAGAQPLRAAARAVLAEPGGSNLGLPLVLEGTLRVVMSVPGGRELLLYRVRPGELCLVSSLRTLGVQAPPASVVAHTDLIMLNLPGESVRALVSRAPAFAATLFGSIGERVSEMVQLIAHLSASPLEQRLARLLVTAPQNRVVATHQELADDLGSSRENVSRILEHFSRQAWVRLGRRQIDLIDRDAIERLAMHEK